ncbi:MAG TPA: LacI family transcriptional regulator [Anaerolineae bacterium]|nr:LacI family transcriptional regulator [Anaerolineae bacterium]HIQ06669.1 LacI family transcriptional regulator [Anaerolineae bacterium]
MARVTIKEVAKRAGVSKTAVSFAFNDPSRLSQATVEKILKVAKELGYAPHPIARSLNTGRTGVLGLLFPQDIPTILESPFFIQFMRGVGRVCDQEGLSLMLVPPVKGSMLKAVNHAAVDGFVVIGLEPQDPVVNILRERYVPFVVVDSDPPDGVPCVNIDDYGGARAAMMHAINYGHRRVAIVAFESGKEGRWREYTGTLGRRLAGYLEALATVGLPLDSPDVHILECENSVEGGAEAFRHLWQASSRPTAILAMSDTIALGVMDAARQQGLQVPGDLSLIGYDDIPEAQWANPPLTTVHQPMMDKGEQAAQLLINSLRGELSSEHYTLPTQLIVRRSVAPPPSTVRSAT